MIIKTQKKIKSFVSFVKKFNFILKNFTSSIKFISFGISHFFFLKIERNLLAILLFQLLEHKYIDFVCLVDFSMAARVLYPSPDKQIKQNKKKSISGFQEMGSLHSEDWCNMVFPFPTRPYQFMPYNIY